MARIPGCFWERRLSTSMVELDQKWSRDFLGLKLICLFQLLVKISFSLENSEEYVQKHEDGHGKHSVIQWNYLLIHTWCPYADNYGSDAIMTDLQFFLLLTKDRGNNVCHGPMVLSSSALDTRGRHGAVFITEHSISLESLSNMRCIP